MILRRADNLSESDSISLGGVLWNVARVAVSDGKVEVILRRGIRTTKNLNLLPDDLVQLDT